MILKISLRAKGGVPKTLLEQKHRLNFLYFPQNTLMLTESREEFSDLHSIFRLRALRYSVICILFLDFVRYAIGWILLKLAATGLCNFSSTSYVFILFGLQFRLCLISNSSKILAVKTFLL